MDLEGPGTGDCVARDPEAILTLSLEVEAGLVEGVLDFLPSTRIEGARRFRDRLSLSTIIPLSMRFLSNSESQL